LQIKETKQKPVEPKKCRFETLKTKKEKRKKQKRKIKMKSENNKTL